jgi:hypothetical protein
MRLAVFLAAATLASAQQLPELTQAERLRWAIRSTIGPQAVVGGVIRSGLQTWTNSPREYGPGWEGFGRRNALRLPGSAFTNLIEGELGSLWGEDPRYPRLGEGAVGGRVWNAIKFAFVAKHVDGHTMPAYARYIALPASNALQNTYRPDSQTDFRHTASRIGFGFVGGMVSNSVAEFMPDIFRAAFRRK